MTRKHNRTGRSTTERFVLLPYYMLTSAAWRSLSPVARSIFVELALIYNGSNNGSIALSTRDAAERVRCSKDTAARGLLNLVERGFIRCRSRGHFDRKKRHASEYLLTFRPCDRSGERALKSFMRWEPKQPKFIAGPTSGTDSPTRGTAQAVAKEDCRSGSDQKDRGPSCGSSDGPTSGTHIIYQEGCGDDGARNRPRGGSRHAT
jgi:hypothetical protein